MRNAMKAGTAVLALLTLVACSAPAEPVRPGTSFDFDQANVSLRRAKAITAAHAVLTTQLALRHLLGALAQAASQELGGAQPLAALGAADPVAKATYKTDLAAGTGRIDVVREGRVTVALDLAFTKADTADGFRFDLTRLAGQVEGFAIATQGTRVAFRQFPGEAGWGADVNLDLALSAEAGDMRRAQVRLTLPAVPAADGVVLGSLAIDVPAQEARFDGTIMAAAAGPITRGGLNVAGRREFDVRLAAAGAVEITPVSEGALPEPTPTMR